MDVGILGPLTVGGVTVGWPRRDRVVLEVLAMRPGAEVSAERLADALWAETPPTSWAKVVQGSIVRLRKAMGPTAIETGPRGYRLHAPADTVDSAHFERLLGRGRELLSLGEPDRATYVLGEALGLWRGAALIELEDWEPGMVEARRLDELRFDADELRLEAMLRVGRHREVMGAARAQVQDAPLRERRWALLALAQYQSGQQAEALRSLHEVRTVLSAELGLDPGPDLVALEAAIRQQDPALVANVALSKPRPTCPYRGLVAYDVADAEDFYGREREVAACRHRLATVGALTLIGPSGSGKSSLVRAGLAAGLAREGRRAVVITPGLHPLDALAGLPRTSSPPVLVVDQCEEVVGLCTDPSERAEFLAAITAYADRAPLIVAVRADRLGDLSGHPGFTRLIERSLYLLNPMTAADLADAIEGPARGAGLRLEAGLVDLLVREVEGEPGALPLLSHALRATWEHREGNTLTVAGYRFTGGVRGAVAQSAEAVYAGVLPDQRLALRDLLLRMVAPSPEGDPMRSRLPRRLVANTPHHEALIEILVAARLVTSDDGVVELAHEALVRAWPRLHDWLDEDAEGQRILRHLLVAADTWDSMHRPNSELYRGTRLAKALEWSDQTEPDLTPVEKDFLEAGRRLSEAEEQTAAEQARQQKRINRRLRGLLTGVVALTVGALIATAIAVNKGNEAADQRRVAVAQRNEAAALALAAASVTVAGANPALGVALAAESLAAADPPLPQAIGALAQARLAFDTTAIQEVRRPLTGPVRQVAFSPDGEMLAGAGPNGVRMWDPATGREHGVVLRGRTGSVFSVSFNDDGSLLAGAGADGVRLWDPATGDPAQRQLRGRAATSAVAFSDDGSLMATAGADGVRLWDPETGDPAGLQLRGQTGETRSLAFNPEGSRLATVGRHGEVQVWDAATGARVSGPLQGLIEVLSVTFTPDGVLATSGSEGGADALRLWDPETGKQLMAPLRRRGTGAVYAMAITSDGRQVATAGGDGTVRVWNLATGEPVGTPLRGHPGDVESLAFSHDGNMLASVGSEGAVRLWAPTGDGQVIQAGRGAFGGLSALAFSPDGSRLATAGENGTIQLWDPITGDPVGEAVRNPHGAQTVAFSPGGDVLASAGLFPGTVWLWHMASGHLVGQPLRGAPNPAWSLAFSADGRLLAVGGFGSGVRLWDPVRRVPLRRLKGQNLRDVRSVAFSPQGSLLAAAGADSTGTVGTIRLWKPRTGEPVGDPMRGQSHTFSSVAFSPNGQLLASGGTDGSVRLWDPATGEPIGDPLSGHIGSVYSVAFSPDAKLLASSGEDETVRLWDPVTRNPVGGPLRGHAGSVYSVAFRQSGRLLLASAGSDGAVRLWDWNADHACELAATYVTLAQLEPYLPSSWDAHCDYPD